MSQEVCALNFSSRLEQQEPGKRVIWDSGTVLRKAHILLMPQPWAMSKAKATCGYQEYVPQERKEWKIDEVDEWQTPWREKLICSQKGLD